MRIHGAKTIRRRTGVKVRKNYQDYMNDLRADFFHICGYCGKHEMISHKGMEPDHFVPINVDSSRKCDYSNLVYSCFTCNRKKSGKWPTGDKDRAFDDEKGIIDPASPEYDTHLSRTGEGSITYNTNLGEYIVKNIFKFDIRPTREIWQATQLHELSCALDAIIATMTPDEAKKYIEVVQELKKLNMHLFERNE